MVEDFAAYPPAAIKRGTFDFLRARARFVDGHTLELNGRGGQIAMVDSKAFYHLHRLGRRRRRRVRVWRRRVS